MAKNPLLKNKIESHVVEFKFNNEDPAKIGKYLSALSNAARLNDKDFAYVLWGVADETGEVLGTVFSTFSQKVGNQTLIFKLFFKIVTTQSHRKIYQLIYSNNTQE
mgnify:CR=1 FL=1